LVLVGAYAEGRLELRNFGVFEVKKRRPRQGRNPRTGEKVMVGERVAVTFKAGQVLKERVAECHGKEAPDGVAMSEGGSLQWRRRLAESSSHDQNVACVTKQVVLKQGKHDD